MPMPTTIILTHSISEDHENTAGDYAYPIQGQINEWLERERGSWFVPSENQGDQWVGGSLVLGTPLLVGCFNHFVTAEIEVFWEFVKTLPWRDREEVQMFVKGIGDDKFRIYNLTED